MAMPTRHCTCCLVGNWRKPLIVRLQASLVQFKFNNYCYCNSCSSKNKIHLLGIIIIFIKINFDLQISFASGSTALSDRNRFKRYFRNSLTFELLAPALHSMLDHFKWRRIAVLTQDENLFTGVWKLIFVI